MKNTLGILVLLTSLTVNAQQASDASYNPKNSKRTIDENKVVTVAVDAAHHNYHTMHGRYLPFTKVLRSDGYTVQENAKLFTEESLQGIDILVIANAISEQNSRSWDLPNYSAFADDEVKAVSNWISNGGSLLLIADHMPMPKAAEPLGAAFGFEFQNGYAFIQGNQESIFNLQNKLLVDHPILRGMSESEKITQVRTFGGQAFPCPLNAKELLVIDAGLIFFPEKIGQLNQDTPRKPIANWCQAATVEYGKGRVAVFGEAAMFSNQSLTQNGNTNIFGMGAEGAEQNEQLLLNVMHWLTGKI